MAALIVLIVVAAVVLITIAKAIRIVPQARAGVVERLGRYYRTLDAGLALVVPYVDRVKPLLDLREGRVRAARAGDELGERLRAAGAHRRPDQAVPDA